MTFLRVDILCLFTNSMTYLNDTWQNWSVFIKTLRFKHEGHTFPLICRITQVLNIDGRKSDWNVFFLTLQFQSRSDLP